MNWEEAFKGFARTRNLEDDWDGFGTPPPTRRQLEIAAFVLGLMRGKGLPAPDDVGFVPTGEVWIEYEGGECIACLLYTSPSPRDLSTSRMPSSA